MTALLDTVIGHNFFYRFSKKYTDLMSTVYLEFLSCLVSICKKLATLAKTKIAVGRKSCKKIDPGMFRAYSIDKPSYLYVADTALGDDDELTRKKTQISDTSTHNECREKPEHIFSFILVTCQS